MFNTILLIVLGFLCAGAGGLIAWYRVRARAIALIREMIDSIDLESLADEPHHLKDKSRFDALSDCLWHVGNRL